MQNTVACFGERAYDQNIAKERCQAPLNNELMFRRQRKNKREPQIRRKIVLQKIATIAKYNSLRFCTR